MLILVFRLSTLLRVSRMHHDINFICALLTREKREILYLAKNFRYTVSQVQCMTLTMCRIRRPRGRCVQSAVILVQTVNTILQTCRILARMISA